MTTRADVEAALARFGRRHGWGVSFHSLGYYKMRFLRSDGTILVRLGAGGRIIEVAVTVGGCHYQLNRPARQQLQNVLAIPPRQPTPAEDP